MGTDLHHHLDPVAIVVLLHRRSHRHIPGRRHGARSPRRPRCWSRPAFLPDDQLNFGSRLGNADFNRDGREDLLVGAPPPFPTPVFDTSASVVFVFPGTASGVSTTPARLDGTPGFGAAVSAGVPSPAPKSLDSARRARLECPPRGASAGDRFRCAGSRAAGDAGLGGYARIVVAENALQLELSLPADLRWLRG